MTPEYVYLSLTLVLLVAIVLVVPLAQRLGLGTVSGYLLAGVMVGPSVLGMVGDSDSLARLAEFGIVFLMFVIGIELRPARLWRMRRLVFVLGSAQLLGTTALLALLIVLAGRDLAVAVAIGAGLAMSSTALVLQLLAQRRELATTGGRAAIAILLLQDVAVAPLISLVYLLAPGNEAAAGPSLDGVLQSLLALALLLVGGRLVLHRVLPVLAGHGNPDLLVAVALLLVLGAAWLMHLAGLSLALGAFLAGVLLAESPYRHQVVADIHPFRGILLGLFFLTVGTSIDLGSAFAQLPKLLALTLALMFAKAVLLGVASRAFGLAWSDATRLGLRLAQGGEFALVLFALAADQRLIDPELRELLVEIVVLSLLLSAPAFRLADAIAARLRRLREPPPPVLEESEIDAHVVVCGFGRVGAQVANLLGGAGLRWVAADRRAERVEQARSAGLPVYYGDAARPEILRALRAEHARLAVVTLDDAGAVERCLDALRRLAPHCRVVLRAPDLAHARQLRADGAARAVPETAEYSLQLGLAGLAELAIDTAKLEELEAAFRARDYERLLDPRAGIAARH